MPPAPRAQQRALLAICPEPPPRLPGTARPLPDRAARVPRCAAPTPQPARTRLGGRAGQGVAGLRSSSPARTRARRPHAPRPPPNFSERTSAFALPRCRRRGSRPRSPPPPAEAQPGYPRRLHPPARRYPASSKPRCPARSRCAAPRCSGSPSPGAGGGGSGRCLSSGRARGRSRRSARFLPAHGKLRGQRPPPPERCLPPETRSPPGLLLPPRSLVLLLLLLHGAAPPPPRRLRGSPAGAVERLRLPT